VDTATTAENRPKLRLFIFEPPESFDAYVESGLDVPRICRRLFVVKNNK